jgi:hypothetical protein
LELFTRSAEKVLRELIGDLRLASHQHFAFHEYKDPHCNRLFAYDANGSVSSQLAQFKIRPDKVPVSIVLYIDGTFLKKGIPIRPVYSEYSTPYRMLYRVRYRLRISQYRERYVLYSSDIKSLSVWIKLWNSAKRGCKNPKLVALRLFGAGVMQPGQRELPLCSE